MIPAPRLQVIHMYEQSPQRLVERDGRLWLKCLLLALPAFDCSQEQGKSERKEDEDSEEKDMEEERANMLRRRIRNRESIRDDIFNLIEDIDEDEEKLNAAGAILNAKDLEEGKNLLLYAAAYGRVELFSCLKMSLEKKVSTRAQPRLRNGARTKSLGSGLS